MNVEMLYDDVAMENTHYFLISANNNLKQAKNNYDSSKLTGDRLVTDAETFMKEIEPYLVSYNNATEKIYTGASNSNGMNIQAKGSSQIVENIKKLDFSKKSADSFELQDKLNLLGYDIGDSGVDGIIGQNTLSALNEFLADKNWGLIGIGSTDDITIRIFELLRSYFKDMINELKDKIDRGEATKEEKIKYTQIVLRELGYYPATEGINGSANKITEYAVMTYCVSNGIDFSSVDVKNMELSFLEHISKATKTYAEVKQERLEQIKSGKVDLDMSSENQRIEIQLMLKASGYYTGDIDGKFGGNIQVALRHICEDRGLCSPDMTNITDWSQITLETFAVIATTDKRGLEEFKRSDESDKTFMGAVLDLKAYYASHGFKYCMKECNRHINPTETTRASCQFCNKSVKSYSVDCSTAVTAYLYYYAKANGSKTMMKEFNQQKNSGSYVIAVENDGYINGVKYFEVVSQEELQEGDILVMDGHVEVYAGSMANETHANVYNAGGDSSIAEPGITKSGDEHIISGYSYLRPISPEEVQKIDNAN